MTRKLAPGEYRLCPFCDFDEPPVTVHADTLVQAFVSREPINRHHVLIVPCRHYERFTDVPAETLAAAMDAAQRASRAIGAVADPDAITLMSDDDHLIPRFRADAVVIEWNRVPDPGQSVRAGYAHALREALPATA